MWLLQILNRELIVWCIELQTVALLVRHKSEAISIKDPFVMYLKKINNRISLL